MNLKLILFIYWFISWFVSIEILGTATYVEYDINNEKKEIKNNGTVEAYIYTTAFMIFVINIFMYACFRLAICYSSNNVNSYLDYLILNKSMFIYFIIGVIPPLIIFVSDLLIYFISATYFNMGDYMLFVYALKYYNKFYINIIYTTIIPILLFVSYKFIMTYTYEGFEYMKYIPANMNKFANLLKRYQDLVELAYDKDEDKAIKKSKLEFTENIINKIEKLEGNTVSNEFKFRNRVNKNKINSDSINSVLENINKENDKLKPLIDECFDKYYSRTQFMKCIQNKANNLNIEISGELRNNIYKYFDFMKK